MASSLRTNSFQCALAFVCLAAFTGRSATIADYALNGIATSSDTETNSTAIPITATGLTLGYANVGGQQGLDTTAKAVDNGDSYDFSVTARPGFVLDLNAGTLTLQDRTSHASTFSYSVFSSVDSFATALASYSLTLADVWTSRTVDLTGAPFDDLSSVTFRLVLSDTSPANSPDLYFDNITLNGLVLPIPEPTTVTLMLLGTLLLARSRQGSRQ